MLQYSCPENPHGQKSLVGYSPWGCKESDMIERLSTQLYKKKNWTLSKFKTHAHQKTQLRI